MGYTEKILLYRSYTRHCSNSPRVFHISYFSFYDEKREYFGRDRSEEKKKKKEEKKLFSTSLLFNVLTIFQSLVNNEEEERGSGYPEWRTFEIRCIYPGLELRRSTECNHFISTFTRESPGGPPPICPPFYNLAHNKGETSLWEIDERATMLSRRPPADLSSHHRVCFALLASLRPPSVIDSDLSVEKDDTRECRIRERIRGQYRRLNGAAKANSIDGARAKRGEN